MKKNIFTSFLSKISLLTGVVLGSNFLIPNAILAENFAPIWKTIEINQGPHSENLLASEVFSTGLSYYYRGHLDYATLVFEKAISIDPNMDIAHYLLANSLYQKGRTEDAILQYEKAIGINPFVPEGYNNLGTILSSEGQYTEAIEQYDKALEIDPLFGFAVYNKGIALIKSNQYQQGLITLEEARKIFHRKGQHKYEEMTFKYIQCGVIPLSRTSSSANMKPHPVCQNKDKD